MWLDIFMAINLQTCYCYDAVPTVGTGRNFVDCAALRKMDSTLFGSRFRDV